MTTATEVAAPLVQSLQNVWQAIQKINPDVPDVVITFGTGIVGRDMLKLGHFAASSWSHDGKDAHELFVGAEGLTRGAQPVLGTLLHEAAHAAAENLGIQDTSRQGRYHNKNFKEIANRMGIEVEHSERLGWSTTTVPDATAALYEEALLDLDAAITAHRYGWEGFAVPTGTNPTTTTGGTIKVPGIRGTRGRTNSNNGVSATCGCGRRIRIARSTLELGVITCGVCGEAFTE